MTSQCVFARNEPGFKTVMAIFSEDKIASASSKEISIWKLDQLKNELVLIELWQLKGHNDFVQALAVMGQQCLISASNDHSIKIWDVEIGYCITTIFKHKSSVKGLAILSGNSFVSGSQDGNLYHWSFNWKQSELALNNWQAVKNYCQLDKWGDQLHLTWTGGSHLISDEQKINAQIELKKILTTCFPMVEFIWHEEAFTNALTIQVAPIHFLKFVTQTLQDLITSRPIASKEVLIQPKKINRFYSWQKENAKPDSVKPDDEPSVPSSSKENINLKEHQRLTIKYELNCV